MYLRKREPSLLMFGMFLTQGKDNRLQLLLFLPRIANFNGEKDNLRYPLFIGLTRINQTIEGQDKKMGNKRANTNHYLVF